MQLSYIVPLLFPILFVPSCQSVARQVSPKFPIQHFPILHVRTRTCMHLFPRYLMYVSLLYYNSSYGARFLKGRLVQIQD